MKITGNYVNCMVILPNKQVKDIICLDCATRMEALAKIKAYEGLEGAKLVYFEREKIALDVSDLDITLNTVVQESCPVADMYL